MVKPISTAISTSVQDSTRGILPSSHVENGNFNNSSSSNKQLRDVTKSEVIRENIIKASKETVERTVQAIKNYIESNKRSLDISVHEETGAIMVKVISEVDGKVIREVPPEKFLDLAAKIEELAGSLFNETA